MANLSGWAQEPLERVDARTTLSGWAQGPLERVGARTTSAFSHVGAVAQGWTGNTPAGIARSLEMQRYGLCNDRSLATLSGEGAGLERPVCRGRAMPNGPLAAAADNVKIVRTRAHVACVFGGRGRPVSSGASARRSWTPLGAADRHGCGVLPQPARGPCTCGWRDEARRLSLMRAGGRRAGDASMRQPHSGGRVAGRPRRLGARTRRQGRQDPWTMRNTMWNTMWNTVWDKLCWRGSAGRRGG